MASVLRVLSLPDRVGLNTRLERSLRKSTHSVCATHSTTPETQETVTVISQGVKYKLEKTQ